MELPLSPLKDTGSSRCGSTPSVQGWGSKTLRPGVRLQLEMQMEMLNRLLESWAWNSGLEFRTGKYRGLLACDRSEVHSQPVAQRKRSCS